MTDDPISRIEAALKAEQGYTYASGEVTHWAEMPRGPKQ